MNGVLLAESAILIHLKTIGIVFLVLSGVVIALFALRTSQCDFNSHDGTSRFTEIILSPKINWGPGLPRIRRFICRCKSTIYSAFAESAYKQLKIWPEKGPKFKKDLRRGIAIIAHHLQKVKYFICDMYRPTVGLQ